MLNGLTAVPARAEPYSPSTPVTESPLSPVLAPGKTLAPTRGLNMNPLNILAPEPAEERVSAEAPAFEETEADAEKKIVLKEGPNGKITYVERAEDSQLIVELMLDDGSPLFDALFPVYQVDETFLVPLGKFAEAVGFPITVDTGAGTAGGWFLVPENTFRFSSPYNSIEIAGKKIPVGRPGIVETHLDDIYVSPDLLSSWFPIGLTMNYHELRLYIKALADLPVQERARRHDRWGTSQSVRKQPGLEYDPKDMIKLPYRMYAAPAMQITHSYGMSLTPEGGSTSVTGTSLNATSDVFGMSARASASFSSSTKGPEQISGLQFSLSKEDYDGNLLGPLHATQYALGDVSAYSFPMAGGGSGRGFTMTNQPYNFVSDASNFRVSGFGTAGWDVEVFQGNELIAFSLIDSDGAYDFPTLPLKEGFNLFKIVLYGPNGEKEERYDRFYLGQNMVPKGKTYYNASALQSLSPLLDASASPSEETPPLLSLAGEYGLSRNISVSAGVFHGPISSVVHDGAEFGLRASSSRAYAQMNTYLDKSGGQSANALVTGNLTETMTFNIRDQAHRGYAPGIRTTSRSTVAQISKMFDFKNEILPDFNASLQAGRDVEETGRRKLAYVGRLSANFMGLSIANEIERDTFSDASPDTYDGNLSLRTRTPLGLLHGGLRYRFHPLLDPETGTIDLQTSLTPALSLSTALNHSFGGTPVTSLKSVLDWKLDKVHLGISGQIDTDNNRQINVSMNYNLMPRTLYGDYAISEITSDISAGRLIIRPFMDQNGNGAYDKGEDLVRDVRFRNMLRGTVSTPVKDGTVILSGLSPGLANRITVEEISIGDIFLTPLKKEIVVLGKTGVNGPVDFAFNRMGEITGTLVTSDPATGQEIPLSEVRMILLDQEGRQVAEVYSESDGYFSFDSIPVGSYEVFFPVSETLQRYYAGGGEGPALAISFENPGLSDVRLRVEHDRILLENSSGTSPADINKTLP
ncbi:MAG: carboxypeptidase-like regulatory domain-containing protein [Pseudomonadota bacterium]